MRTALVVVCVAALAFLPACARLRLDRRDRHNPDVSRLAPSGGRLETRIRETFGLPGRRTPWYENITRVRVTGSRAELFTDIKPNAEGRNFALPICDAVFEISPRGVKRVVVYGRGGVPLDRCG